MDGIEVTYGGYTSQGHRFIVRDSANTITVTNDNLFGKSILKLHSNYILKRYGFNSYIVN